MDLAQMAKERMDASAVEVREYGGGDGFKAIVRMLDATDDHYRHELVNAKGERVTELQAQVQQLRAIRKVLAGESHSSPAT